MKQATDWTEQIRKYLDNELSPPDVRGLLEEAEHNETVREQLHQQRMLHAYLLRGALESPSATFTQRVMAKLEQMPASVRHSPRNGLLLLMGVLAACTVIVLGMGSDLLPTGIIELDTTKLPVQNLAPRIAVDLKWIINGLIIVNLALGFVILDRTVLRPFFERRAG